MSGVACAVATIMHLTFACQFYHNHYVHILHNGNLSNVYCYRGFVAANDMFFKWWGIYHIIYNYVTFNVNSSDRNISMQCCMSAGLT